MGAGLSLRGAGRWSAFFVAAGVLLAGCDDAELARRLFRAVDGLGEVRFVRWHKTHDAPDHMADVASWCITAVAELSPDAPDTPPPAMAVEGSARSFGGDWQPSPMPDSVRRGVGPGCQDWWPEDMRERAERALGQPGSFWIVRPWGLDEEFHLYSPAHGIVGYARIGPDS